MIEKRRRVLGEEHPDTLTIMNSLMVTYIGQEQRDEAEELGKLVIEKRRRILGEEHSDTLSTMTNLMVIYVRQERWAEAEQWGIQV